MVLLLVLESSFDVGVDVEEDVDSDVVEETRRCNGTLVDTIIFLLEEERRLLILKENAVSASASASASVSVLVSVCISISSIMIRGTIIMNLVVVAILLSCIAFFFLEEC